MSITIGYLNKKGKPADSKIIELMKKAYDGYPYDDYSFKTDGEFALAHMNMNIFTDNPIETQPVISNSGRYIGSGRINIFNRKELINNLNLAEITDTKTLSDSRLFLYAYEKWENDTFDIIHGNYAFVIWDKKNKKLIIARDHTGCYPLYFYETNENFYFASTIKAFFELPDFNKEINYQKLIESNLPFPIHSDHEATLYKNIYGFLNYHYYIINQNGIIDRKRHWHPENYEMINYNSKYEYIEHFKEIYEKAVQDRISKKGQMGSYLSGGLDSSSVTVITNDYLKQNGRFIRSYSSVPQYPDKLPDRPNSVSDETPYIDTILEMYPEIKQKYIKSPDFSPLDAMDFDLNNNGVYTGNFQNGYWYFKILQEAVNDGVNIILTGQAGNLTISRTGADLYEYLFRKADFIEFYNQMKYDTAKNNTKYWRFIAGTAYSILKKYAGNWFPKKFDDTFNRGWLNPFSEKTIKDFNIEELQMAEKQIEKSIKFKSDIMNTFVNQRILQLHTGPNFHHMNIDYYLKNNIESRDPTNDKKIHEFTKSIPPYIFKNEGIERYLIRSAMEGRLPEKVRLNPIRGKQAKDLSYRMRLVIDKAESIIHGYENNKLQFDMDKINSVINEIKEENITQELFAKTTKILLHPISIIKFLNMNGE